MAMPETTREARANGKVDYRIRGRSFVTHRSPRPDALDPVTGERLPDVVVFQCHNPADKDALVQDDSPFFTTPHFDGYHAVLLREEHLDRISRDELAEVIADAWLSRAPQRLATAWLATLPEPSDNPAGTGRS